MQRQNHAYRAEEVVRFLRLVVRTITGKRLVIWEHAPIQ